MRPSAVSGGQYQGNSYKTLCFLCIQGFPAGPAGVPEPVEFYPSGGSAGPECHFGELEWIEMNWHQVSKRRK